MTEMFYVATSFNQDLSQWCVSNITTEPTNFALGATNWTLPRPVWGTCPRGENIVIAGPELQLRMIGQSDLSDSYFSLS